MNLIMYLCYTEIKKHTNYKLDIYMYICVVTNLRQWFIFRVLLIICWSLLAWSSSKGVLQLFFWLFPCFCLLLTAFNIAVDSDNNFKDFEDWFESIATTFCMTFGRYGVSIQVEVNYVNMSVLNYYSAK